MDRAPEQAMREGANRQGLGWGTGTGTEGQREASGVRKQHVEEQGVAAKAGYPVLRKLRQAQAQDLLLR